MPGKCGEVSDKEGITGGLPDAIYVPYLQSFAERVLRLAWAFTIEMGTGCGVLEAEIRAAHQRTERPMVQIDSRKACRGSQYRVHKYRKLFDQFGMAPLMSRWRSCYDNAPHGKPLRIAKINIHHWRFKACAEAIQVIIEYIVFTGGSISRHVSDICFLSHLSTNFMKVGWRYEPAGIHY